MKAKVTLTIDREVWRIFRSLAIQRGLSASAEIQRLIAAQAERWAKESKC